MIKLTEQYPCPVFGQHIFEEPDTYDMCPVCGWFDDGLQRIRPDMSGCNYLSLNEYRKKWQNGEIPPPILDYD